MLLPTAPRASRPFVVIPALRNGPRAYGNGGYSAGVFAADLGASARVVLRRPVPVGRPLRLVEEAGGLRVLSRGRTIAEVEGVVGGAVLEPPVRPGLAAAEDASERHPWGHVRHALSDCFVCSPNRRDGLGATPGTLATHPDLLAAPFHTDSRLSDPAAPERIRREFLWAALDCPSFPAADLVAGRVRLLGTTAVTRVRDAYVGESLVVVGWTLAHGVRSVSTASALLDADGDVVAAARNVWVAPSQTSWAGRRLR